MNFLTIGHLREEHTQTPTHTHLLLHTQEPEAYLASGGAWPMNPSVILQALHVLARENENICRKSPTGAFNYY